MLCVMFVGKTGVGKTSCANNLLGRTEFEESAGGCSKTQTSSFADANLSDGTILRVIDTPGYFDTNDRDITSELRAGVEMAGPTGVHLVVYVMDPTNRYTQEQKQTTDAVLQTFGSRLGNLRLLLSNGDQSARLTEFIETPNEHLQQLVTTVGGRAAIFKWNNLAHPQVKEAQRLVMITVARQLSVNAFTANNLILNPRPVFIVPFADLSNDSYIQTTLTPPGLTISEHIDKGVKFPLRVLQFDPTTQVITTMIPIPTPPELRRFFGSENANLNFGVIRANKKWHKRGPVYCDGHAMLSLVGTNFKFSVVKFKTFSSVENYTAEYSHNDQILKLYLRCGTFYREKHTKCTAELRPVEPIRLLPL